jgi:hypothetical protein
MAALDDAIAAAVEKRFAPTAAQLAELRGALDTWETAERSRLKHIVTAEAFQAIGEPAPTIDDAARVVLDALRRTAAWIYPSAPAPQVHRRRESTAEERECAARLLADIDGCDIEHEPPPRRLPLLRSFAAEVRQLMLPLSPECVLYDELFGALARIGALRRRGQVTLFVEGLGMSRTGDWESLALEARRDVAKVDRAIEAGQKKPLALVATSGKRR